MCQLVCDKNANKDDNNDDTNDDNDDDDDDDGSQEVLDVRSCWCITEHMRNYTYTSFNNYVYQ